MWLVQKSQKKGSAQKAKLLCAVSVLSYSHQSPWKENGALTLIQIQMRSFSAGQ